MSEKSNNIGESFKKERRDLGFRQIDVSFFLNSSESMISHLEKEPKNNIFLDYIYFMRYNGTDLNKLFDDLYFKEKSKQFDEKKREFENYRKGNSSK